MHAWKVIRTATGGLAVVHSAEAPNQPVLHRSFSPDECFEFLEQLERRHSRRKAIVETLILMAAGAFIMWSATGWIE